jgi:hypothetical protein
VIFSFFSRGTRNIVFYVVKRVMKKHKCRCVEEGRDDVAGYAFETFLSSYR